MTMGERKLKRLGLIRLTVPLEHAVAAERQIKPILEWHIKRLSAYTTMQEQMARLALDCYTQGLMHGNQLPRVEP